VFSNIGDIHLESNRNTRELAWILPNRRPDEAVNDLQVGCPSSSFPKPQMLFAILFKSSQCNEILTSSFFLETSSHVSDIPKAHINTKLFVILTPLINL
jgi:hypothetical protein